MTKTIVFYDEQFPYPGDLLSDATKNALANTFEVVNADSLKNALEQAESFIHLHGPYFSKNAWNSILGFLEKGGTMITLGGLAFRNPVRQENGDLIIEHEQTTYHQDLHILEALSIDQHNTVSLQHNKERPLFAGMEHLLTVEKTWGLIMQGTTISDHPEQIGSSGPMDRHIYPLLNGVSKDHRIMAAPAVLIENTKGQFAGGQWMLINQQVREPFWDNGGIEALQYWASQLRGVTEIWLKPHYATYNIGEQAAFTLQVESLKDADDSRKPSWTFSLRLTHDNSPDPIWQSTSEVKLGPHLEVKHFSIPVSLEKGMYQLQCIAKSDDGDKRVIHQGFWVMDEALLQEGQPLTRDRDYFRKNGRPLPVVGMTYMGSDVARKFLSLPNVAVWDRDMADMKKAGINLIRTGIWTAWRSVMFVDGHPSEEILRAIDAFILTARKHDLEVTFTFFSFTPEAWEGENPYLDPRSVKAQKRLIASIVRRHKNSTNVQWDLINEPSMFDPKRAFSGPRTLRDPFEQRAYANWLKERHGTIGKLQERWNMTPVELPDFNAAPLPEQHDISFDITDVTAVKKSKVWLDYTLFTMEMHNQWARDLSQVIKENNNTHLVTVGQDEGLGGQRPSPFFYSSVVDYTTVHSWWLTDHMLWDVVFAKAYDKPSLIQETGIMYTQTPDGQSKRSDQEAADFLERKYGYAFASGGAGAVQWIWNTNYYMDNLNESYIGALRADGSQKPEAEVTYKFGRFMKKVRDLFVGRELEEIAVIFPYSNDFSNRKLAFDATTKLTRVLSYQMKTPFRALGEYHLDSLKQDPPKLLIVPSAHNISQAAFEQLIGHIESVGGTLLLTGPIGLDEYWQPINRLSDKLPPYQLSNVAREEAIHIDGEIMTASFGHQRVSEVSKDMPVGGPNESSGPAIVETIQIGKGTLIHCPLPLELNESSEVLTSLYSYALKTANVTSDLKWHVGGDAKGIYGRKLTFEEGNLYIFISESGQDEEIEITDVASMTKYRFITEKQRVFMFATDIEGQIVAIYDDKEVSI